MSPSPDSATPSEPANAPPHLQRSAVRRYAVTVLAVVVAVGLQRLCTPLVGEDTLSFTFLFPAIALAAWYGGTGPALFAMLLSGALAAWLLVRAPAGAESPHLVELFALGVFALVSLCIVLAIHAMHRANARVQEQFRQRDRTDQALRESEERFRMMADGLPLLVWVHSAETRELFANRAYCEFFGVTAQEMSGDRWLRLLHPEDAQAYNAEFHRCMEARQPFHAETRVRRADGQWRWIESWARPRWTTTNEFLGFVGASADVTDRKANEAALHESQDRLQLALAGVGMGVWSWNMDANRIEWSPEVHRILGVDTFDGTVEAFTRCLHPDDAEGAWAAVRDSMRRRVPYSHEFRIIRPDGAVRWMHDRGRVDYHPDGRPRRMLGVVSDVTERRKAQEQLELAHQQALAASRAKDQFLAALSHELRTPLTPALIVSAELEQSPQIPVELRDQCATVRASIELEARLIDDLLDVARVSRGKMHMVFATCDAHAVLRQAVEIVQPEFTGKQIHVDWELDIAPAPVTGDAVRLQQVFWNLLRNAAKFTPSGGRVQLRSRVGGETWRLEVVDTGIGIAAADLGRVFEDFVQCEPGAEPQLGGLGLGLSISAFIVREHGGKIWAESAGRGQGSTFVLELPLTTMPIDVPAAPATGGERRTKPLRILVVEDHAPTRRAFATVLARRGHTVIAAEGVAQARAEAAAHELDVVVSDLGLADGSGLELMRELRRSHGLCGIALSGYAMESDVKSALEAGFLVHLTKPVKLQRLDEALAQAAGARECEGGRCPGEDSGLRSSAPEIVTNH